MLVMNLITYKMYLNPSLDVWFKEDVISPTKIIINTIICAVDEENVDHHTNHSITLYKQSVLGKITLLYQRIKFFHATCSLFKQVWYLFLAVLH